MKKLVCCFLCLILALPFLGCHDDSESKDPGVPYTLYEKPAFTSGILESDLLVVEPGNYDRASRSSNHNFLESGYGYYYLRNGLKFAEKNDMNRWTVFCSDPECTHGLSVRCTSQTNQVYMNKEGRICFLAGAKEYSYLAMEDSKNTGYLLASVDIQGNDVQLEHIWAGARFGSTGSGGAIINVTNAGYYLNYMDFTADGEMELNIYIVDERCGEICLEDQLNSIDDARSEGLYSFTMFGDTAYSVTTGSLLWCKDGELVESEVLEFPTIGSHLSGNTVRFYRTNDGYHDYDLLTGEETRIADAQVDDAAAWIIEPNCILETTLFGSSDADQRAEVTTHTVKLFDGQAWHEVTLPDDIANGTTAVEFMALTSDSIILNTPDGEGGDVTFYRIALGQETYTLEQIGQFTAE